MIEEHYPSQEIPEAEWPAFCRWHAAWLRAKADLAETIEMRITLLGMAELSDRLARGEIINQDNLLG